MPCKALKVRTRSLQICKDHEYRGRMRHKEANYLHKDYRMLLLLKDTVFWASKPTTGHLEPSVGFKRVKSDPFGK